MTTWLFIVAGLVLLVGGGDLLVRGAVQIASRMGISPLVIGLTLVGFGTSMPELVTSVQAALRGSPGIAYGNIVGSNISNVLLILGLSAIVAPIAISSRALNRDSTVMVSITLLFVAWAATTAMGHITGALFVTALVGYVWFTIWHERQPSLTDHGAVYDKGRAAQDLDAAFIPSDSPALSVIVSLLIAFAGLALILVGGSLLVSGALDLARAFGVSDTIVGLTVVAVGTSMPELATSLVAAARKQTDVAFGNVIGSNIYNILGIGGATALISPAHVPAEIVRFDNLVMLTVSILVVGFAITGRRISRREGGLLLACFVGYVTWNWMSAG